MKLRLIKIRDQLADSFWFVPAIMALISAAVALGLVAIDHAIGTAGVANIGFVWSGGPDGARSVLSVIAGSVMTVVSIVFSLTITALATTSSHYGPRVLRNFTSDRGVQFTLGTFIATFTYCLLVLRTVRSVQEQPFVPYLAVTIGIALAVASLAVLIFFIHHIAQSIQTENLIANVGVDLLRNFDTLFPAEIGEGDATAKPLAPDHWKQARSLHSPGHGYVERIDDEAIMALTTEHGLEVRLERRPGDFIIKGAAVMRAQPAGKVTQEIERGLLACFSLGSRRTPHQDPRYALQQLVEIAAHALSPGINEPYTALGCLDWIGNALDSLGHRSMPTAQRFDANGVLRVLAQPITYAELAGDAFNEIRIYGADNPDILKGMLLTIGLLAPGLRRDPDRATLGRHVRSIAADAARIYNEQDRRMIHERAEETLRLLGMPATD